MLIWQAAAVLLVAYVPGELLFRLPFASRDKRASIPAEERVFWTIVLSILQSSIVTLGLAGLGAYSFNRLLLVNAATSALALLVVRGALRFGPSAPAPTWASLLPVGLAALSLWLNVFVPPAEYIIGGKDPGVYFNEGIQIAQRGSLVVIDEQARAVPPVFRDLFFIAQYGNPDYYANRFMGFFLLDPDTGETVGQFPHLYPIWVAIGYGVAGLNGGRYVLAWFAALGVLAVYFTGARLMGRRAAAAGAGLLAIHLVQIWHARYPNAEIVMQPLVFAGLLAYARTQLDADRFFGPVAGLLLSIAILAHFTGVFAVAAVIATALLGFIDRRPAPRGFWVTLVAGTVLAVAHVAFYLPPYLRIPLGYILNLQWFHHAMLGLAALCGVALLFAARRPAAAALIRTWLPVLLVATTWLLAVYAFFIRTAGGTLAPHDATALRTFTSFYFSPYALAAALIGFALLARTFSSTSVFLVTMAVFSIFFFYKIRIVPEHFWFSRRFTAVVLPGLLLLVGAAWFADLKAPARSALAWLEKPAARVARYTLGALFIATLGRGFWLDTHWVIRHIEYAGLIPHVEQLARTFEEDDLVLVEARNASDLHVLALPLAYIYARNVLVMARPDPDKPLFREFLLWAHEHYPRVFFVGGGGTELLSKSMTVKPIRGDRFQIPEYESAWNAYPRSIRFKEFDLGVYEFLAQPAPASGFDLEIGVNDDLYVRRFYAKEVHGNGTTFRWARDESYVSIMGTTRDQQVLTLWMADGGRPDSAPPAEVQLFLNGRPIGSTVVRGPRLEPYTFAIPPAVAIAMEESPNAAQLRIMTRTWNPAKLVGGADTRDLGVLIHRVQVGTGPQTAANSQ
jgi:hypothetical protein